MTEDQPVPYPTTGTLIGTSGPWSKRKKVGVAVAVLAALGAVGSLLPEHESKTDKFIDEHYPTWRAECEDLATAAVGITRLLHGWRFVLGWAGQQVHHSEGRRSDARALRREEAPPDPKVRGRFKAVAMVAPEGTSAEAVLPGHFGRYPSAQATATSAMTARQTSTVVQPA